ncbi:hypothetical protein R6Q59_004129 [Mikania micrantha]|uniref:Uncharacterized protein n=1 Tax=Mikania micrantha TaxID=192012 RepID=A0A5N6MN91_9ASTR|nr:hypothetical protein E3N88_30736 [Mikania micrantha]
MKLIILKAMVEDEELLNMLFSFLEPEHPHSTLLAGYFSKAHQDIIKKMAGQIGITSNMEVLIRLISADEHLYTRHVDLMQWLEYMDVLEVIVDKFSSTLSYFYPVDRHVIG